MALTRNALKEELSKKIELITPTFDASSESHTLELYRALLDKLSTQIESKEEDDEDDELENIGTSSKGDKLSSREAGELISEICSFLAKKQTPIAEMLQPAVEAFLDRIFIEFMNVQDPEQQRKVFKHIQILHANNRFDRKIMEQLIINDDETAGSRVKLAEQFCELETLGLLTDYRVRNLLHRFSYPEVKSKTLSLALQCFDPEKLRENNSDFFRKLLFIQCMTEFSLVGYLGGDDPRAVISDAQRNEHDITKIDFAKKSEVLAGLLDDQVMQKSHVLIQVLGLLDRKSNAWRYLLSSNEDDSSLVLHVLRNVVMGQIESNWHLHQDTEQFFSDFLNFLDTCNDQHKAALKQGIKHLFSYNNLFSHHAAPQERLALFLMWFKAFNPALPANQLEPIIKYANDNNRAQEIIETFRVLIQLRDEFCRDGVERSAQVFNLINKRFLEPLLLHFSPEFQQAVLDNQLPPIFKIIVNLLTSPEMNDTDFNAAILPNFQSWSTEPNLTQALHTFWEEIDKSKLASPLLADETTNAWRSFSAVCEASSVGPDEEAPLSLPALVLSVVVLQGNVLQNNALFFQPEQSYKEGVSRKNGI